jgi:integrase
LTPEQEQKLLEACDDWQFPIFLTLLCTGMRPGELVHLLLPDDLDLVTGWLRIRNKPGLGWQVKTRNERDIPLVPVLVDVLRRLPGDRRCGPVFVQSRCSNGYAPPLIDRPPKSLEQELARRVSQAENASTKPLTRTERLGIARTIWRDAGALKEDWLRKEFMHLTRAIGMPEVTAPKTLRHTFATILQDANVDPLIRNELMGHAPSGTCRNGHGLGMTTVYTHTRPETKRHQLEAALGDRPFITSARQRLAQGQRIEAALKRSGDLFPGGQPEPTP